MQTNSQKLTGWFNEIEAMNMARDVCAKLGFDLGTLPKEEATRILEDGVKLVARSNGFVVEGDSVSFEPKKAYPTRETLTQYFEADCKDRRIKRDFLPA